MEEQGRVAEVRLSGAGARLVVRAELVLEDLEVGQSLCVDGVCLTAVEVGSGRLAVDVSEETLRRTTLGEKRAGSRCNLERAVRMGDRLGGHLVTGHIDGVGKVVDVRPENSSSWITIEAPREVMRYIISKGSVAVDGVSLTVAAKTRRNFSVAIIPHTARVTTLGALRVGQKVNLEADIIGKYVERFVAELVGKEALGPEGLTREFLIEHGFATERG